MLFGPTAHHQPEACDLYIIGGNGDLAFRKLYPSIYLLDKNGLLPPASRVIAVARQTMTTEAFKSAVHKGLKKFAAAALTDDAWERFQSRLHYMAVDATNADEFREAHEKNFETGDADRIFYLATPPSIFSPICKGLEAAGLINPRSRIVVEKPLGEDLASFQAINNDLLATFEEHQVFRIDHYLGKETVQNLLALRFANSLFEPLWNSNYIDNVQISVAETVGVEGRWDFYDAAGASRDMLQNHILQLLCLVAMEPPSQFTPQMVRDEKLKVLQSLKPVTRETVRKVTVRGQYNRGAIDGEPVLGYGEEEGARVGSDTETFVAVKAELMSWRWAGVPFYLRTGKRLAKRCSEIVIQFKQVPHTIFRGVCSDSACNKLIIQLQPDEGVRLLVLNKVPGIDDPIRIEPLSLNLSFSDVFRDHRVPDAYERLLYDVMRNNSTLFMRADEVEAAWKWLDSITSSWKANNHRVLAYPAGTWGPAQSVSLVAKDGRSWHQED